MKANGFSVVREYVGHGIGTQLHEEPQVPNYVDRKNENPRLKEGMVLAVEPMVNAGKAEAVVLKDKWTAVTKDGSKSAHFEHCIAVLEGQQRVLAHLVGAVKRNFVRLVPGDRVEVELSPHDPTRGRITRKL